MKARNFRYIKPATLRQAFRILADFGEDAVPLAGGQSLLAGLNMRLSAPKVLVDIGDLSELRGEAFTDEVVTLGALTRHAELLSSELVRQHLPLLRKAAPYIGHIAIRNRGTLGGSLAYADPAAELPACAVALNATIVLGSASGSREVNATDFYKSLFETELKVGELITAVKIPVQMSPVRTGFAELSRRHGDFALVGLAAAVSMQGDRVQTARLAYLGCADTAKLAQSVGALLTGKRLPFLDEQGLAEAIHQDLSPDDTPGVRSDTRLHLANILTRRVLLSVSENAAT